jgi:hypothetical protein
MNNILLISEELLKTYSYINENVSSDELRYAILISQNIEVQESLGTNLYQYILDAVDNGTITDPSNANYKHLLDKYIQPALVAYALYRALDNFIAKFMSVGLIQNRSEQGNPIDFKLFLHLKTNAKNDAEFSDNLLRRHLIFKSGEYPLYNNGSLNDGQLPPDTATAFNSPITMPGAGFYYNRKSVNGWCNGPLCADSNFPSWYAGPSNSGNLH